MRSESSPFSSRKWLEKSAHLQHKKAMYVHVSRTEAVVEKNNVKINKWAGSHTPLHSLAPSQSARSSHHQRQARESDKIKK